MAALIAVWTMPLMAGDRFYVGEYQFTPTAVYDGDTVKGRAEIWPGLSTLVSVRLAGIDTPELRGKCAREKAAAKRAKVALQLALSLGMVTLRNVRLGKYAGRVVATVLVDGVNVAPEMIRQGYGRVYNGGRRQGWC